MSFNTRRSGHVKEKTIHVCVPDGQTNMTGIQLQDHSRSYKVIPQEDLELVSTLNQKMESSRFQDNEHQQDFKNPKKSGTSCIIPHENHRKVMAPRTFDKNSKTLEEEIADHHLDTNVTVNLLDQLDKDYPNFDIRVNTHDETMAPYPNPDPAMESSLGVEFLPISDPFPVDSVCNQVELSASIGSHSSVDPSQSQYPNEGGFQVDNDMLDVESKAITLDGQKSCRVEPEIDPESGNSGCVMELDHDTASDSDALTEVPRDKLVLNDTVYGTENALEELAKNHDNQLLKTGNHCVFTKWSLRVLRDPSIYHEELLGQGSFGTVHKCTAPSGEVFVRKEVKKESFHPSEVIFTNKSTHPSIIKSNGFMVREQVPEIYMEYAGQSLLSLLQMEKTLHESTIWTLTWDLCKGLEFLDQENVVHFDIKPENLFVMKDGSGLYRLKIGDFGSARMPGATTRMSDWTPEYCAPEMGQLVLRKYYPEMMPKSEQEIESSLQPKTDVFSAGLAIAFMYEGNHVLYQFISQTKPDMPKEEYRLSAILVVSVRQDIDSVLMPEAAGSQMKEVLQGMLQFDVEKRCSAKQTLEHMEALSDENNRAPPRKDNPVEKNLQSTQSQDVVMEKKMQPVKSKAARKRGRKKKEMETIVPQVESEKTTEILAQNPQLKRRLVRDELKRKLQNRTEETLGKVMRLEEIEPGEMEDSQGLSLMDRNQEEFSGEGNQNRLPMDENQIGFSIELDQNRSSMNGKQIDSMMSPEYEILSGSFVDINPEGPGVSALLLELPFQQVQVSESHSLVCQAQDDWSVQESTPVQDATPGNLPDFSSLGF